MEGQEILGNWDGAQWSRPTERIGSTGAAGARTFRANCGDGCRFDADGSPVEAAPNLLAADHNSGDHAVIAWFDTRSVLETFYWHRAGSGGWRDCGRLFGVVYPRIRCERIPIGIVVCWGASGSQRVSVWGSYPRNRAACSANGTGVANCFSSIRRSIHRNCRGVGDDGSVAREGRHSSEATEKRHSLKNLPVPLDKWIANFERWVSPKERLC
jgi:hypothetical protein